MKKILFMASVAALVATGATAASVDFEDVALGPNDATNVGTSYSNGGITFTSTENMHLVGVGRGTDGFVPNDTPGSSSAGPANFGTTFLTGDFNQNTDMMMTFGTRLTNIAFDIVDIDGGNDKKAGDAQEEQFTFGFLLNNVLQSSQLITSRDLTGPLDEAGVIRVSYAGLFDKVSIVGVTPGGTRNIGWGIDNIDVQPVPLPAGVVLMMTALGGFGVARARKARQTA
jgi:hypothetical protein